MTVQAQPDPARPDPLAAENARLAGLSRLPGVPRAESRCPLGEGVWLSHEPGTEPELAFAPEGEGFRLGLEHGERARWVSLSADLPRTVLGQGRFLGLLAEIDSRAFVSYRPCLRFLKEGGAFDDVFTDDYVLSPGGPRRQLSHVAIDRSLLEGCTGTELHIFFQGDRFELSVRRLEILLIP